jgi:hypothetical protein
VLQANDSSSLRYFYKKKLLKIIIYISYAYLLLKEKGATQIFAPERGDPPLHPTLPDGSPLTPLIPLHP